tara:strand:+ start:17 stop:229 length:213 start_codon:yes stop_codon:yes gene_type:complete
VEIERMIITGDQIPLARLITLKHGLKLEMKGMQVSRGRTCYSIIKNELGLRGNRQKVLDQLEEMLEIDNA